MSTSWKSLTFFFFLNQEVFGGVCQSWFLGLSIVCSPFSSSETQKSWFDVSSSKNWTFETLPLNKWGAWLFETEVFWSEASGRIRVSLLQKRHGGARAPSGEFTAKHPAHNFPFFLTSEGFQLWFQYRKDEKSVSSSLLWRLLRPLAAPTPPNHQSFWAIGSESRVGQNLLPVRLKVCDPQRTLKGLINNFRFQLCFLPLFI